MLVFSKATIVAWVRRGLDVGTDVFQRVENESPSSCSCARVNGAYRGEACDERRKPNGVSVAAPIICPVPWLLDTPNMRRWLAALRMKILKDATALSRFSVTPRFILFFLNKNLFETDGENRRSSVFRIANNQHRRENRATETG
jgi:hypothetical protein